MANERSRVFRTSSKSPAGVFVQDKSAALFGNHKNFVVADDRGITIKGPISFISDSMGRRTGGLFVGINDFLEMIPQTILTPIPSKIPFPPIFEAVAIAGTVGYFLANLV